MLYLLSSFTSMVFIYEFINSLKIIFKYPIICKKQKKEKKKPKPLFYVENHFHTNVSLSLYPLFFCYMSIQCLSLGYCWRFLLYVTFQQEKQIVIEKNKDEVVIENYNEQNILYNYKGYDKNDLRFLEKNIFNYNNKDKRKS